MLLEDFLVPPARSPERENDLARHEILTAMFAAAR
jgi:hypothetical protein